MSDAVRYSKYHQYGPLAQMIADHLQGLGFLNPSVPKQVIKAAIQTAIDKSDVADATSGSGER